MNRAQIKDIISRLKTGASLRVIGANEFFIDNDIKILICKFLENYIKKTSLPEHIPNLIFNILIDEGQADRKFKLSETIKYSPNEIRRILEEYAEESNEQS